MMMNADLGAAQSTKVFLGLVGAGAVERVSFLVIDSFHFKALVKSIPCGGFVSMQNRSFGNAGANEGRGLAFRAKHSWHRIAATFANDDDQLPFATLVLGISAVTAMLFLISWLHIAAKIATIDFGRLAFSANDPALQFICHGFA